MVDNDNTEAMAGTNHTQGARGMYRTMARTIPNWDLIQSEGFKNSIASGSSWVPGNSFGGVFLFTGPASTNLLETAQYIARVSACLGTRDVSCTCRHCLSGLSASTDIHVATLNQYGNLLSSTLENLDRFFSSYPTSGAIRRVLIVESVERATTQSASSLLKVLEGGVQVPDMAIFTSSDVSGISRPLLSRMEVVRFGAPSAEGLKARYGSSQAGRDLALASKWLKGADTEPYLAARKVISSVILGIQAGDVTRAWRAIQPCCGQVGARPAIEVLYLAMTDMLSFCGGSGEAEYRPAPTVLSSMREDMAAYALVWGEAHLASLADDLRAMLSAVPGRDLRPTIYRWIVKAVALAATKKFVKPELSPTSLKGSAAIGIETEDNIVIDFE